MRVLGVEGASAESSVAILDGDCLLAQQRLPISRPAADQLPSVIKAVLAKAGLTMNAIDAVAVGVGPGSFTGLRAALALGYGLASAGKRTLVGVTAAEAFAQLVPLAPGRMLLTAVDAMRSGQIFLSLGGSSFEVHDVRNVPTPPVPVAVAGDAAVAVAAALASRGADVCLTNSRFAGAAGVVRAAAAKIAAGFVPAPPKPVYVNKAIVRLPLPDDGRRIGGRYVDPSSNAA